jgi:hypothetical protein
MEIANLVPKASFAVWDNILESLEDTSDAHESIDLNLKKTWPILVFNP